MNHRVHYYSCSNQKDKGAFSSRLSVMIKEQMKLRRSLVILCIGTDKVTGDSLGPFVGYRLEQQLLSDYNISIYGTLKEPVHAVNLEATLRDIHLAQEKEEKDYFVLVVDASLGFPHHLGYVTLSNRPLNPGEGVNKKLPQVGEISITGIIGEARNNSYKSQLTLRQARLYDLMQLADFISDGILCSVKELYPALVH